MVGHWGAGPVLSGGRRPAEIAVEQVTLLPGHLAHGATRPISANATLVRGRLWTAEIAYGTFHGHQAPRGVTRLRLDNGTDLPLILLGERAVQRITFASPDQAFLIGGSLRLWGGELGLLAQQWAPG